MTSISNICIVPYCHYPTLSCSILSSRLIIISFLHPLRHTYQPVRTRRILEWKCQILQWKYHEKNPNEYSTLQLPNIQNKHISPSILNITNIKHFIITTENIEKYQYSIFNIIIFNIQHYHSISSSPMRAYQSVRPRQIWGWKQQISPMPP